MHGDWIQCLCITTKSIGTRNFNVLFKHKLDGIDNSIDVIIRDWLVTFGRSSKS